MLRIPSYSNPVMLAGMGNVAHSKLVAAVSNAGGIGTIGGVFLTPKVLRQQIAEVKALITDKQNPKFGVDLVRARAPPRVANAVWDEWMIDGYPQKGSFSCANFLFLCVTLCGYFFENLVYLGIRGTTSLPPFRSF